jgi:hypothetical protein
MLACEEKNYAGPFAADIVIFPNPYQGNIP